MALHNLARVTSATTGTGTLTLGSAVSGFLTFADAGVSDGEVVTYAIRDGSASEIGRGTYTSSGTTLSRDTIYESTNSGNAISCSGSQEVFITPAAEELGGMVLLERQDKDAGAGANFTFDVSWATYFRHLVLKWGVRGTDVAAQNIHMQFNTDTGNNYHWRWSGGSSAANVAFTIIGFTVATGATGGLIATGTTDIYEYRNTNWHKNCMTRHLDTVTTAAHTWGGRWASTSAITSVKIFPAAGNFAQYSFAEIYGVK